MKIWLKLLIGILAGIAAAVFLPDSWSDLKVIEQLYTLAINIGRYVLFPLIFFSVVTGVHSLVQKKKVFGLLSRTVVYMIIVSAVLAVFGTVSVLLLSPERIPVFIEESANFSVPTFYDVLTAIFPRNFFEVIFQNGDQILPIFIMAVLIGFNMNFDKVITRGAAQLFESLSGIFNHINSFIIELMGFFMVPMAWYVTKQIMITSETALFKQMLIAISADTLIIIFVIYPILLYFAAGHKNPYKWIYAALAPVLAGAASGDSLFSLSLQLKNSSENMGSRKEAGSVSSAASGCIRKSRNGNDYRYYVYCNFEIIFQSRLECIGYYLGINLCVFIFIYCRSVSGNRSICFSITAVYNLRPGNRRRVSYT